MQEHPFPFGSCDSNAERKYDASPLFGVFQRMDKEGQRGVTIGPNSERRTIAPIRCEISVGAERASSRKRPDSVNFGVVSEHCLS
jgi:hypothetical protein